jgi:hypothetical protein
LQKGGGGGMFEEKKEKSKGKQNPAPLLFGRLGFGAHIEIERTKTFPRPLARKLDLI